MKRQPSPYQLFKKSLAPLFGMKSKDFTKSHNLFMNKIFKRFPVEQHEIIAGYPTWLIRNLDNYNIREALDSLDSAEDVFKQACCYAWVEHYLEILENHPS